MQKLLTIVLAVAVAGCATVETASGPVIRPQDDDCPGKGNKDITISYGDARIVVTPKQSASKKKNERLMIVLDPQKEKGDEGVNYESLVIHIVGKDNKSNWLNMSIAADQSNSKSGSSKGRFPVCIDKIPADIYEYEVIVPTVGTIDPRVDINN